MEFSPYQYAANNPIKFIDVNGDSIWINTTEGDLLYQKGKMYSKGDNGELSENKGEYAKLNKKGKVKGYTGALGTTVNALKTIEKSNFGSAMSNTLQSSKFNFTIKTGSNSASRLGFDIGNGKISCLNNNGYAFQVLDQGELVYNPLPFDQNGSGGVIIWNQNDGAIGLAHEMGHALDANFGLLDSREIEFNGGVEEIREIRAVYCENRVRQDLKMPLRERYINGRARLFDRNWNPMNHTTPFVQKMYNIYKIANQ